MTTILDQRTTLARLYDVSAAAPVLVEVPSLTVLAIDGTGDPAVSNDYQAAIESLMALSWGVRALRKAGDPPVVIKVMPLEGQWSLPAETVFSEDPAIRAQLRWSMQVVQPPDLGPEELDQVRRTVRAKKPALGGLDSARLETLPAGRAMALLHIGPYANEPASLQRLHEAIRATGAQPTPGHREIYLSDPRRVAPEKLKTVLRVAME